MELKTFKCPNCGAELNVRDGVRRVKCEYCLSVIRLDKQTEEPSNQNRQAYYEHNIHIEEPARGFERPLKSVSSSSFGNDTEDFNRTFRLAVSIILTVLQIIAFVWGAIFLVVGFMFIDAEHNIPLAVIAFVIGAVLILGPFKLRKVILRRLR